MANIINITDPDKPYWLFSVHTPAYIDTRLSVSKDVPIEGFNGQTYVIPSVFDAPLGDKKWDNKKGFIQKTSAELSEGISSDLAWSVVRIQRNQLLANADILINKAEDSNALGLTGYTEQYILSLRTYRQLLRDLPQTYTTPEEVIYPVIPVIE